MAAIILVLGCDPSNGSQPPAPDDPAPLAETEGEASGDAPTTVAYRVRLDESLDTIEQEVCFRGAAPRALTTSKDGERFVTSVTDAQGRTLDASSGVLRTRGLDGQCVTFDISVDAMMGAGGWGMGTRAVRMGDDLLLSPSYWLWYPSSRSERGPAELAFELPAGYTAAVGWRRDPAASNDPTKFVIAPGDYDWRTHAAFGRFELAKLALAGDRTFEVAVMGEMPRAGEAGIHDWIETSAVAVAQLFDGEFPRRRVTVIVMPVPGGGGPVHFGLVTRGGEPSVIFFVSRDAPADAYIGEWTAVHELSHMAMPLVRRQDAWMSEGFATYYQEVLRARANLYDEPPREGVTPHDLQVLAGLEGLADGFTRGERDDGLSLAEASGGMKGGYGRVYWGGALVAFLLDLELRVASEGRHSLDDAMRAWMSCCGDEVKIWKAFELFAAIEDDVGSWTGDPQLLTREARQLVEAERLPSPAAGFEALGVQLDRRGRARLNPAADSGAKARRERMLGPANARVKADVQRPTAP